MNKPYLRHIVICEEAILNRDGNIDYVGIAHEIRVPPERKSIIPMIVTISVIADFLIALDEKQYVVKLLINPPNGEKVPPMLYKIGKFDGNYLTSAIFPMEIEINNFGNYWFKIFLDDALVGSTPFTVRLTN